MTRYLSIGIGIVAAALGAFVASRELATAGAAGAADAAGTAFFSQTFPDSAGKPHALADYRGKVVVINFWATWCVPCVEEIPELSRLSSEYRPKNVAFVGIGIDNASNIVDFEKKVTASYPLLVAGTMGSDLLREYGDTAGGLPFTLILDGKGAVRATKLGKVSEKELRAWLKPLTGS
jgi:thiol-disulfide isomerase/thioredoxin